MAKAVATVAKKPATSAPKSAGKEVAVPRAQSTALSVDSAFDDMRDGMGFENVTSKDLVIPRLTILQALSPQLQKKKPEYIEGAEMGNFCNTATGDVYEELQLIPCSFARIYLEWAPRESGKGLVHNHGTNAAILEACEQDEKRRYFLDNGNQIIETMTFYCILLTGGQQQRCFVPLSSTQLKSARKWMTALSAEKLQRADGSVFTPPIFFRSWKVTPTEESNNEGDWYGWRFEQSTPVVELDPTLSLLNECKAYYEQASSGLIVADPSPMPEEAFAGAM